MYKNTTRMIPNLSIRQMNLYVKYCFLRYPFGKGSEEAINTKE